MSTDKPDKEVRITLKNGVPVPDTDPVDVWRNQQKLRWVADFDFQISVDGYSDITYSRGGGSERFCKTGYFGDSAAKSYKYTISANGVDNDPTIEIKP